MAVLTLDELVALRQEAARGEEPDWDKPAINTALQGVEDVLEAQVFDATPFVAEVVTTDVRAQGVKAELDAGQIPTGLMPVVEDWLDENPPSMTTRSANNNGIDAHVNSNMPAFLAAVSGMPANQRAKIIRLVIQRRVEMVV